MAIRRNHDAIRLLENDHETLRGLLESFADARAGAPRDELLAKLADELHVHTRIEERVLYPAFLDASAARQDRKLHFQAIEEHALLDQVVAAIRSFRGDDDHYAAKAKLLQDLVLHHAREEEEELFPRARRTLSRAQLRELGARMAAVKATLQERPPARRERAAVHVWRFASKPPAAFAMRG